MQAQFGEDSDEPADFDEIDPFDLEAEKWLKEEQEEQEEQKKGEEDILYINELKDLFQAFLDQNHLQSSASRVVKGGYKSLDDFLEEVQFTMFERILKTNELLKMYDDPIEEEAKVQEIEQQPQKPLY